MFCTANPDSLYAEAVLRSRDQRLGSQEQSNSVSEGLALGLESRSYQEITCEDESWTHGSHGEAKQRTG